MQPQCPPDRRGLSPAICALGLIAAISLALRWWRLDLMSFRFDSAEAMFRARDTFRFHFPPMTGIENSLGFRNPGGFIWVLLPTALVCPDPRLTAAWIGILSLSGLWPMYKISQRWMPGWNFLIPCAGYALMPSQMFAARAIWAQNLMPSMAAWSLWGLLVWGDSEVEPKKRSLAASGALAVMFFATTVHLSGGAYVLVVAGILLFGAKRMASPSPRWWIAMLAALVFVLTLVPSLADWNDSVIHPRPKPEHIVQFESRMPPPKGLIGRVRDSLAGLFDPFTSIGAAGGIEKQLAPQPLMVGLVADGLLIVLLLGGIATAILVLRRDQRTSKVGAPTDRDRIWSAILLMWIFGPILIGSIAIPRINGSYFAPAQPALLLLCSFGIARCLRSHGRLIVPLLGAFIITAYSWFFLGCMSAVDASRYVAGIYYVPLTEQVALVNKLYDHYVPPGPYFVHLSGNWFQRSYDYIYSTMKPEVRGHFGTGKTNYAVLEDIPLRLRQTARAEFFRNNITFKQGNVGAVVFDSPQKASDFVRKFWNIPELPDSESSIK